jgi:CHAT domain-containing protein/Tfp pilus assembly protein PilF
MAYLVRIESQPFPADDSSPQRLVALGGLLSQRAPRMNPTNSSQCPRWPCLLGLSLSVVLAVSVDGTGSQERGGPGGEAELTRPGDDLTATADLWASAWAKYNAGEYQALTALGHELMAEGAGPRRVRLSAVRSLELLDILLTGHLETGDLGGATRLLYRQWELSHRDAAPYYRLGLAYLGRGLFGPAKTLFEQAGRQPAGTAAARAAAEKMRSLPPLDNSDPHRGEEIITLGTEYPPLRGALIQDAGKALDDYRLPLTGPAREVVLKWNFTAAGTRPTVSPKGGDKQAVERLLQLTRSRLEGRLLIIQGKQALDAGAYQPARDRLTEALAKSREALDTPSEARSHVLLGASLRNLGDPAAAADQILLALAIYRSLREEAQVYVGLVAFRNNLRSIKDRDRVIALAPKLLDVVAGAPPVAEKPREDAQFHLDRAKAALNSGNFEKATLEYRLALRVDPYSKLAYHKLAGLVGWGANPVAAGHFESAGDREKFLASVVTGQILEDIALRIDPEFEESIQFLAVLNNALQGRVPKRASANPEATRHYDKGDGALARRDFTTAIHEYELALQLDPRYARARVALGDCYFNQQDFPRAIANYEQALHLDPGDIQARRFLQHAYEMNRHPPPGVIEALPKGDLARNSRDLSKLIRNGRRHPDDFYQLGMIYLARRMNLPAQHTFRQGLARAGTDSKMVIDLLRGIAYASGGSPQDPDRYWQILAFALEDEDFRAALARDFEGALARYEFLIGPELRALLRDVDIDLVLRCIGKLPRPSADLHPGGNAASRAAFDAARDAWSKGNLAAAMEHARQAIDAAREDAQGYLLAALIGLDTDEYDLARVYLKDAEPRVQHGPFWRTVQLALGTAFVLSGDHQEAVHRYRLAHWVPQEPRELEAIERWQGRVQARLARPGRAAEAKGPAGGDGMVDPEEELVNQLHLKRPPAQKGGPPRIVGAQELAEENPKVRPIALAKGREEKLELIGKVPAEERRSLYLILGVVSNLFLREGDLKSSRLYAELGLANARLIPDGVPPAGYPVKPTYAALANLDLGRLYQLDGDYTKALEPFWAARQGLLEAETQRKRLGLRPAPSERLLSATDNLVTVDMGLSEIYSRLGDAASARRLIADGITRSYQQMSNFSVARTQAMFAEFELERGDFNGALHSLYQAIQSARRLDPTREYALLPELLIQDATVCQRVGAFRSALAELIGCRAAIQGPEVGTRETFIHAEIAGHVAGVYESLGRGEKAEIEWRRGVELITLGRGNDSAVRLTASDTIDSEMGWFMLARLGQRLRVRASSDGAGGRGTREEALRRFRQAFGVIETTRRKIQLDALGQNEAARMGYSRDKGWVFGDAFELLRELSAESPGAGYDRELLECAERAKSQALVELLRERRLGAADNSSALVSAADLLEALAASKTLVVEYYATDRAAYALAFGGPRRHLVVAELRDDATSLAPAELERRALRLRASLSDLAKPVDQINKESEALYRVLFPGPVRAALGDAADLVIVPHGALHLLPFAALWDGRDYLYRSQPLAVAPSAGVLLYARQRRQALDARPGRGAAAGGPALLSIINPTGDRNLLRLTKRQEGDLPKRFPPPPSRYYAPGGGPGTLRSAAMTPQRFLAEAGGFDYLHIYSHAKFLLADPLGSYIELAGGRLSAADLYPALGAGRGLEITARLVTLAACETGEGRVASGDEVLGLPRALLHAGATAMVVTLWRADAGFADRLMVRLYTKLRRDGAGTAGALREAMEETIARGKEEGYAHPYYWAPFVLMGDPR